MPLGAGIEASPPILMPVSCDGHAVVTVGDHIRAVAKEQLQSRIGVVSGAELGVLEDGLRQIMHLG
jgi:hypothetical protein